LIKRDQSRSVFDENKLRSSFLKALEKRPVSIDAVDTAVKGIVRRLIATGEREVESRLVGDWVMEALQELDEVAYVRFASVYRSFQDVNAFREEIERMENRNEQVIKE
jgi:transcriptional repressor NrdR